MYSVVVEMVASEPSEHGFCFVAKNELVTSVELKRNAIN